MTEDEHGLQDFVASRATLDWKTQALCVGKQDLFFNDHKQSYVREAKAICADCPVKAQCLEHALTHLEYGVWGGMTANERRMLRRNERKKARLGLAK